MALFPSVDRNMVFGHFDMNSFERSSLVGGPVLLHPDPKGILHTAAIRQFDESVSAISLEFKHLSVKSVEVATSQYPTLGLPRFPQGLTSFSISTEFKLFAWK